MQHVHVRPRCYLEAVPMLMQTFIEYSFVASALHHTGWKKTKGCSLCFGDLDAVPKQRPSRCRGLESLLLAVGSLCCTCLLQRQQVSCETDHAVARLASCSLRYLAAMAPIGNLVQTVRQAATASYINACKDVRQLV